MRVFGGPSASWSQELELLAGVNDRLAQIVWQNGGKASAPKPRPFPRPGAAPDRHRTGLTSQQIRSRLVALQHRDARRRADGGS